MLIRKITESDRGEYIDMAREFYNSPAVLKSVPEEYFDVMLNECLSSPVYAECFILEEGGKAAGYGIILKSFSQEAGGPVIWFDELFIRKEYRGKGFGGQFFNFIFENFPAARYRLEVEKENERAVKLYQRLGFEFLEYAQMIKEK